MTDDYKPRIYYVLGTLFGVLVLYGLIKGYILIGYSMQSIICLCLVVIMILIQYVNFSDIARERYITNYEDKYISEMIEYVIEEHEKETNDLIGKVVFYQDARKTKYIRNEGWCLSMRAYGVEWGNISCLNFYLNGQYQVGRPDENVAKQFALRDWNEFSIEQIVFSGDTAHICRY